MIDNTTTTEDIEVWPVRLKQYLKHNKKDSIIEYIDFNSLLNKHKTINNVYKYILNTITEINEIFSTNYEVCHSELFEELNNMYRSNKNGRN